MFPRQAIILHNFSHLLLQHFLRWISVDCYLVLTAIPKNVNISKTRRNYNSTSDMYVPISCSTILKPRREIIVKRLEIMLFFPLEIVVVGRNSIHFSINCLN